MKNWFTYLKVRWVLHRAMKKALKECVAEIVANNPFPDFLGGDLDGLGLIVDDGVETHEYDSLVNTRYPALNKQDTKTEIEQ